MDQDKSKRTATLVEKNGRKVIMIKFSYVDDFEAYQKIIMLTQVAYNSENSSWSLPLNLATLRILEKWRFNFDIKLKTESDNLNYLNSLQLKCEIAGLKGQLYDYQKECIAFIDNCNGRALINDETGLGKKVQTLAWLQLHPLKRPSLIITTKSRISAWNEEAVNWISNPLSLFAQSSKQSVHLKNHIFIVSYDELPVCTKELLRLNIQVLILDEISNISDKSKDHTKAVFKLSKTVPNVIGLTSISVLANPVEAFNAIKIIKPDLFPSLSAYINKYTNIKPKIYNWEEYGISSKKLNDLLIRSEYKRKKFMYWIKEQVDKGAIVIREIEQVGKAIEPEWQNKFIVDTDKRKELRNKFGNASMSVPIHMDSLGLAYTLAYSKLKGISNEMDLLISENLAKGIADGDGINEIARKITNAIDSAGLGEIGIAIDDIPENNISTRRRAMMIAHTEILRAHHRRSMQDTKNWREWDVFGQVEWSTAGDNRVCERCKEMKGKVFSVEEIEDMIPLHPECRCIAIPLCEGLEKYEKKQVEKFDWLGCREGIDTKNTWLEELYTKLTTTIMIRRLKNDVINDLPQ